MFAETKHYFEFPEKDHDTMLRVAKDKYKQRLEAVTDKVRMIYEEIRHDEVLATMREDPASNAFAGQRIYEICEDNLAIEREETIERLMDEVTNLSSGIVRLEKEVNMLKGALLKAEEKVNSAHLNEDKERRFLDEIEKLKAQLRGNELQFKEQEVLMNERSKSGKQDYKTKSSRMKKKILEQKALIAKIDNELMSTRTALESSKANYEQSLQNVQDDLNKVKITGNNAAEISMMNIMPRFLLFSPLIRGNSEISSATINSFSKISFQSSKLKPIHISTGRNKWTLNSPTRWKNASKRSTGTISASPSTLS